MSYGFSPKLIAQTQAYFLEKYGSEVSEEQATIYLLSLAQVYMTIARIRERQQAEGGRPSGPPPDRQDVQ